MYNYIILGVIITIILFMIYYFFSNLYISPEEAKRLIDSGYIKHIIDVRTDIEYYIGHYPGAIHLQDNQIKHLIDKYVFSKDDPILVYCKTGRRARKAVDILKELGYSKVYYIPTDYTMLLGTF